MLLNSFGSVFSGQWHVDLSRLSVAVTEAQLGGGGGGANLAPGPTAGLRPACADQKAKSTAQADSGAMALQSPAEGNSFGEAEPTWSLEVPATLAKGIKDAIKSAGFLDKGKKASASRPSTSDDCDGEGAKALACVTLPLLRGGHVVALRRAAERAAAAWSEAEAARLPELVVRALMSGAAKVGSLWSIVPRFR